MKSSLLTLVALLCGKFCLAQTPAAKDALQLKDNYSVQFLYVTNKDKQVLIQKNQYGWNPIALRSNRPQSIKEALDSLAASMGLTIGALRLAGLYTYKFEGLPDHQQVSFRTHFTAKLTAGKLRQPTDTSVVYRWVSIPEAIDRIEFTPAKQQAKQLLTFPKQVWGGSYLIIWKDDKLTGSKVLEPAYSLSPTP
ncbi:NUDIX hydrolase [Hymenobacter terrenus]|uniref:NUDIX hydrolase n=1 Tax=Hymenobacter terrenus TaxID=1629124 RepID=UPI0006193F11|nr:NUDIX hydrolase [Hymenobacter terrenus]